MPKAEPLFWTYSIADAWTSSYKNLVIFLLILELFYLFLIQSLTTHALYELLGHFQLKQFSFLIVRSLFYPLNPLKPPVTYSTLVSLQATNHRQHAVRQRFHLYRPVPWTRHGSSQPHRGADGP